MELFVQAVVTLGTVMGGGRFIINGINKDLARHDRKLDGLTARLSRVAEEVAFIKGELQGEER